MSLKYESIISKMTLEEKALMMSGKNTWQTVAVDQYLKECGRDHRTGDFVVNRGQRMNLTIGIR